MKRYFFVSIMAALHIHVAMSQSNCPTNVSVDYHVIDKTSQTLDLNVFISGIDNFQSMSYYNSNPNQFIGSGINQSNNYNNINFYQDTVICTDLLYVDPISHETCEMTFCDTIRMSQRPCDNINFSFTQTPTSNGIVVLEFDYNAEWSNNYLIDLHYNSSGNPSFTTIYSPVDAPSTYTFHSTNDTVICASLNNTICGTLTFCDTVRIPQNPCDTASFSFTQSPILTPGGGVQLEFNYNITPANNYPVNLHYNSTGNGSFATNIDASSSYNLYPTADTFVCAVLTQSSCGQFTYCDTVYLNNSLSLNTNSQISEFTIHPNPAIGNISLTFDHNLNLDQIIIEFIDLTGKTIKTTKPQDNIDINSLTKGIYFVNIKNLDNKVLNTKKLIKQ